ncbi:hypothetical protein [uncultured Bifidobacterium sp.]|uniref:hypothetical protein n=1 Tax=uncultured Bifidobacterium sp. TaxID=165187 RepID=UPI00261D2AC2|nr:hypothetical protein [uncultured Bifidobacterium sp.]
MFIEKRRKVAKEGEKKEARRGRVVKGEKEAKGRREGKEEEKKKKKAVRKTGREAAGGISAHFRVHWANFVIRQGESPAPHPSPCVHWAGFSFVGRASWRAPISEATKMASSGHSWREEK